LNSFRLWPLKHFKKPTQINPTFLYFFSPSKILLLSKFVFFYLLIFVIHGNRQCTMCNNNVKILKSIYADRGKILCEIKYLKCQEQLKFCTKNKNTTANLNQLAINIDYSRFMIQLILFMHSNLYVWWFLYLRIKINTCLISSSSIGKNAEIVRLDVLIGVQTSVPPLYVCEFMSSRLSTKKKINT